MSLTIDIILKPLFSKNKQESPKAGQQNRYDHEIGFLTSSLHHKLGNGELAPEHAAKEFNSCLSSFLESKEEFQEEVREYFEHNPEATKSIEDARKLKNKLRKKATQCYDRRQSFGKSGTKALQLSPRTEGNQVQRNKF